MSGSVKPEFDEQDPEVAEYLKKYGKSGAPQEEDPVDAYLKRFGPKTDPVTVGPVKPVVGPHGESLITAESMGEIAAGEHGLAPQIGAAMRLGRGRPGYQNIGNVAEGENPEIPRVTADKLEAPGARRDLARDVAHRTAPGAASTAANIALSNGMSVFSPAAAASATQAAMERFTAGGGDASENANLFGAAAAFGEIGLSYPMFKTPAIGAKFVARSIPAAVREGLIVELRNIASTHEVSAGSRAQQAAVAILEAAKNATPAARRIIKQAVEQGLESGTLMASERVAGGVVLGEDPKEVAKEAGANLATGVVLGTGLGALGGFAAERAGYTAGRKAAGELPGDLREQLKTERVARADPVEDMGPFKGALIEHGRAFDEASDRAATSVQPPSNNPVAPAPQVEPPAPVTSPETGTPQGEGPQGVTADRPQPKPVRLAAGVRAPEGQVVSVPGKSLHVDPSRFQFKMQGIDAGSGAAPWVKGAKKYNPVLGGVWVTWIDPADGLEYVVNSHHRKAIYDNDISRDRPENVNVLRIEAPDAASARAVGARINIAEGHGSPIDVAQFIRDSGLNAGDLEKEGISLRGDLAQKGTALSQLAPDLMAKVGTGELQESHGVAIGDMLVGEPELQREVAAEVKRAKVRLSADDVREVARQVKAAGTEDVRQETLFGGEVGRKPLFVERARLASTILKKLGADRRVLGFVADQNRAQILAKGGNVIDVERSRELADQSAQLEELFQRLYTRDGPIAKVLTQAAGRVARGEAVRAVTDDIYSNVAAAVQAEIQGGTGGGADPREAEGSRSVSPGTTEAGGLEGETEHVELDPNQEDVFGVGEPFGVMSPETRHKAVRTKVARAIERAAPKKEKYLEVLRATGSTKVATKEAGVYGQVVYMWRRQDPQFRAAYDEAVKPRPEHAVAMQERKGKLRRARPKPVSTRITTGDLKGMVDYLRQQIIRAGGLVNSRHLRSFNEEAASIIKDLGATPEKARTELEELAEDFTPISGLEQEQAELHKQLIDEERHRAIERRDAQLPTHEQEELKLHRARQDRYRAKQEKEANPAPVSDAVRRYREEKIARGVKEDRESYGAEKYEYSSTQVELPKATAKAIKDLAAAIPDKDLAENGREDAPHVTIKYGLHGADPDAVRKLLEDEGAIVMTLGRTSYFPNGESGNGDVLKADVDSPDLHRLNKKIGDALKHTDTHPSYTPHATIAYLKPGLGKKYAGDDALVGKQVVVDKVTFSAKDGTQTVIDLKHPPKPRSEQPEQIVAPAVKLPNGHVVRGLTHYDAFHNAADQGHISAAARNAALKPGGELPDFEDGFVTTHRDFVTREEAYRIAEEGDQLHEEANPHMKGSLGTEDLKGPIGDAALGIDDLGVAEERNGYMAAIADLWERSGPNGRKFLIDKWKKQHPLEKWDPKWASLQVEQLPLHVQQALGTERAWEIIMMSAMGVKEDLFGYGAPEQPGLLPEDAGTAAQQKKPSRSFQEAAAEAGKQAEFLKKQLARMGDDSKYIGKTGPLRERIAELEKIVNFAKKVTTEEIKLQQGGKEPGDTGSLDMFGVKEGEHIQPNKLTALVMQLEELSGDIMTRMNEQDGMLSKLEELQPRMKLGDGKTSVGSRNLDQLRAEFRGLYAAMERVTKDLSKEGRQVERTGIASGRFIDLTHEWNGVTADYEKFVDRLNEFRARRETSRMIGDMFQWEEDRAEYEATQQMELAFGSKEQAAEVAADVVKHSGKYVTLAHANELGQKVLSTRQRMKNIAAAKARGAWVSIVGKKFKGPHELAQLLYAFRSPETENLSILYRHDDGNIAHHSVDSSGAINYVMVGRNLADRIAEKAKSLGVTKVHLGHNHPSGKVRGSSFDKKLTLQLHRQLAERGIELVDHVIINHKIFTWIKPTESSVDGGSIELAEDVPFDPPAFAEESDWTQGHGASIRAPWDLSKVVAGGVKNGDIAVVYVTSGLEAVALEPRPASSIESLAKWIPEQLKALAADQVAIVFDPGYHGDVIEQVRAIAKLHPEITHSLLDVSSFDGSRSIRAEFNNELTELGKQVPVIPKPATRLVGEERQPYEGSPEGSNSPQGAGEDGSAEADENGRRAAQPGRLRRSARKEVVEAGGQEETQLGEPPPKYPDPSGLGQPRSSFRPTELPHALQTLFHPESLGKAARGVAGTIRHRINAQSFRRLAVANEQLREFKKVIEKLPRDRQVDVWDAAEQGVSTGDKNLDAGIQLLHDVTQDFTDDLIALDRLKAEAAIENYVGRFWSKPKGKRGIDFLAAIHGRRPFEGPKSFLKHRSIEFFKEGLDAGLTPATYNFVESQLAKIAEMQRVIAAERTLRAEENSGRAKKVMLGNKPPLDQNGDPWVKIDRAGNDPAFIVYGPRHGGVKLPPHSTMAFGIPLKPQDVEVYGPRPLGAWYAPRDAAAVWAAHLSRGLRGNPIYDAMMAPAQASAQILLGFSGFHFTTIAREGVNSSLALALDDLVNKHGTASRAPGHLLRAPAAVAADAAFGRRIMQQYREPGVHPELEKVLQYMMAGGYRGTAESELWTGERMDNLKRAFNDAVRGQSKGRQLWGASRLPLNALWAGIELQMKPLMGMYVPWMKTAATYRAVAQALGQLPPGSSLDHVHQVMGDIVKEMDYRYGQVQYDNHFIPRVIKNLAQLVFLAPGWTFGTLTLAGRGIGQAAQVPYKAWKAKGVPDELIGKSAAYWIGGVLFLALVNGILTYMHTGEMPDGKDFFAYRDGTMDDEGNPNRHIMPGYEMHDIYSWSHHATRTLKNKLSPALAFMAKLAENRTYFGDMVYDPDASLPVKAKQIGKQAIENVGTPLSYQNYRESQRRGEQNVGELARNAFGITPAKREFIRTDAQNKLAEILSRRGHTALTPDQAEVSKAKAELRIAKRQHKPKGSAIADAMRAAPLSHREAAEVWREAGTDKLLAQFKMLAYPEAKEVWDVATPEERRRWHAVFITKRENYRTQHGAAALRKANGR